MKKSLLKIIICLLCISILPVYASQVNQKKDELSAAQQAIKDSEKQLDKTEKEKKDVQQQINNLDSQIVKKEDEIIQTEEDLSIKKQEVGVTEEDLAKAVIKKDKQYEAMKKRMVHMYKNNKVGYIQIIFSSKNFWEMLNRIQYIKIISSYDKDLLTAYKEQEQIIEDKKAALEEEQVAIEVLYKKQLSMKTELEKVKTEKKNLMGVLDTQSKSLKAKIDEMEEISKELEKEIKRLTAQSTRKYGGGKFAWPVPGHYYLSSEYNPRENPVTGNSEFHQGIDIPAGYGKSVVAAADGQVIVSGWVRGFGKTIMIDHGSGLVTIYGHNSSLVVSNGEYVTKGQQVARIGSTGLSTGNHCHFEVRVNGQHTTPWNYLSR